MATSTITTTPGVYGITQKGSIITVPNFTLPKSLTSQYDYFIEPITYKGLPAEAHIPLTLAPPLLGGTIGKIAQIVGTAGVIIVAPIVGTADLAGAGAASAIEGSSAAGSAGAGAAGAGAGSAATAAKTALTDANILKGIAGLGAIGVLLTDPQFYVRVLEVVAGLYLMFLGVKTLTAGGTSPNITILTPATGGVTSSAPTPGGRPRVARTSANPGARRPANSPRSIRLRKAATAAALEKP